MDAANVVVTEAGINWLRGVLDRLHVGGKLAYPRSGLIYLKETETQLRLVEMVDPHEVEMLEEVKYWRGIDRPSTVATGKAIGVLVIDTLPDTEVRAVPYQTYAALMIKIQSEGGVGKTGRSEDTK